MAPKVNQDAPVAKSKVKGADLRQDNKNEWMRFTRHLKMASDKAMIVADPGLCSESCFEFASCFAVRRKFCKIKSEERNRSRCR